MQNLLINSNLLTLNYKKLIANKTCKDIESASSYTASILDRANRAIDVSEEDYHNSRFAVSKGMLDKIAKSPKHFYSFMTSEDDGQTAAMKFGSMAHKAVLEPELLDAVYVSSAMLGDAKDLNKNTNAYKDAKKKLEQETSRKLMAEEDYEAIKAMVNSVYSDEWASKLLSGGRAEQSVFANLSGIACKVKPDYLNSEAGIVVDLKTSDDASEEGFINSIRTYRYHVQAAMYLDCVNAAIASAGGTYQFTEFAWVVVEKKSPYVVSCFVANNEMLEYGRMTYLSDIEKLKKALEEDKFDGYFNGIKRIGLPEWFLKKGI